MSDSELLIKINADAKNAQKAYDDLRKETSDLEDQLNKMALVSGAAFAAFTAEIYFSVKAFEDGRQSVVQLNTALQNQGIFTKELTADYRSYAEAVKEATGIDDDTVTKAQAVAQSYLGQTKITKELTFAIADLGASMGGDLNAAAEKIGRTIGTNTNAFARQGLVMDETATRSERLATVLTFVQTKAGGLAEEFNKANGYSRALTTAFDDLQKAIGEKFAPIFSAGRKLAVDFFDAISKNPILVDLAVSLIAAGAAVSGLALAIALAVPALLALSAAASAFGLSLGIALGGIPIVIGAAIAAVTFLALNWEKSMAYIKSAAVAAITAVSEIFSGLGKVLSGALTLDPSGIDAGLKQLKNSMSAAKDAATATYQEITQVVVAEGEKQDAAKAAAKAKEVAKEQEHQAVLRALRKAEIDLLVLQTEFGSQIIIDLKTKEIETLKALSGEHSAAEVAALKDKLDTIRDLETQANTEEIERQAAFTQLQNDTDAELKAKGITVQAELQDQKLALIAAGAQTEADIDRKVQEDILKKRIDARNAELLDRKKYGIAYAALNATMNSQEVNATKSAADSLVQLSNSKNETLKSIGKAAAVTQIGIDTARGAMAVYANFQDAIPYPPISIPLGIAAAAAITAYGAERVSNVLSAADGGLVEGGVPGRDSVPALLMPGELVVPKKNFNDVVGAAGNGGGGKNDEEILSTLQSIDAKFSNPKVTHISGDVLTDDSYIDSLVRKISDAVEFRNAQIFGVTT